MKPQQNSHLDIGYMDMLALGSSPLHRLDPRVKLVVTAVFIVAVVSFNRYTVMQLFPFILFPVILISAGGLPAGFIMKKVLMVSPIAVLLGIFNPLIDRQIMLQAGGIGISGGWVSFVSIILRFFLTVTAVLLLVALTGFNNICWALSKMGVPAPFVTQLMFLYRYIFVLTEEAHSMDRARMLRSFEKKPMKIGTFVPLVGHLLLRTLDRAERIYRAMRCRGFDGRMRTIVSWKGRPADFVFLATCTALFAVFRLCNVPVLLGEFVLGLFK